MARFEVDKTVLKIQEYILVIVILFLAGSVITGYFHPALNRTLGYIAVVLLIVAAPIRIIAVAKHFQKKGNRHYQILSYTVILIIILTALVRAIL